MHNVHECAMCVDEILSMWHVGTQFGGAHTHIYVYIYGFADTQHINKRQDVKQQVTAISNAFDDVLWACHGLSVPSTWDQHLCRSPASVTPSL